MRCFPVTFSVLLLPLASLSAAGEHGFADRFRPLVQRYCVECHGNAQAKSGVNYEALPDAQAFLDDPELLDAMLWAVEAEEMPPHDAPQPTIDERVAIMEWLGGSLSLLENASPNDPGFVAMPRLNMNQYERIIQTVTGKPIAVSAMITPDSPAGEGFLNVGEAQPMSVGQFESFLAAAKKVTAHLRVLPEAGLHWQTAPLADTDGASGLRESLIESIEQWHTSQLNEQLREHRNALVDRYGQTGLFVPYFQAAWRYHHREARGEPEATFESLAEASEPKLYPDALRRFYGLLTVDPVLADDAEAMAENLVFTRWIDAWNELPGPDQMPEGEAATQVFSDLSQFCFETTEIDSRAYMVGRKGLDQIPPPSQPKERARFRGQLLQGVRLFDLDLRAAKDDHVWLVTGDAGDGGEGDRVIWEKGEVQFRDGSRRPWQEVFPEVVDWEGNRLPLSAEGSLEVGAPHAFGLALPKDATALTVQGRLHPDALDTTTVQLAVTDGEPRTRFHESGWIPGEQIVGVDGHLTIDGKAIHPGPKKLFEQVRDVALIGNSALRYTNVGRRTVFAHYDPSDLEQLGLPHPQVETRRSWVIFALPSEDLLFRATPEAVADYQDLHAMLRESAQPAQQALAKFLSEQGHDLPEGHLPGNERIDSLPPELRTEAARLVEAARAERAAQDQQAEPLLTEFASKVWRRPAPQELVREIYLPLFTEARKQGATFDAALKTSITALLVSPPFLFQLREAKADQQIFPLGPYELASRLSFALWGSAPDEALLATAADGSIGQPEVLRRETRRMLADPRAMALVRDFGGYWLGWAGFETGASPDAGRFPEFNEALREAMVAETELYLLDLFQKDLPLTNLIESDYSFLNARLAQHYGIDGVEGNEMRKVSVPSDQRGGIFGMGSFLTKLSSPLRTSPVQRGAWILENVVGEHLPPPPANVPLISDDERNEAGETIREQLEAHRDNPACFSCHDRMDPLGIALENFDAIGRWRDRDLAGEPIDSTGLFVSNGETVDGLAGLRDVVRDRQQKFVAHFCRKLLGYFLGRSVTVTDQPLLDEMQQVLEANHFQPQAAIEAVVTSNQFRNRTFKSVDSELASNP